MFAESPSFVRNSFECFETDNFPQVSRLLIDQKNYTKAAIRELKHKSLSITNERPLKKLLVLEIKNYFLILFIVSN